MSLFALENLTVEINTPAGIIRPVDGVSWSLERGETTAVVGESGSGKSVSALAALGLLPSPPARVVGGQVLFKDENLLRFEPERLRRVRGAEIAMIFQEPMTSLNPVRSIGHQLTEHVRLHLNLTRAQATRHAVDLLKRVGIAEPEQRLRQFPHHFSGGMRQRVMIAIALACDPQLIIADEPTTALDVTIQAQILELLKSLAESSGVALVLITHNLGIVARYARTVNVMYAGRIVEQGESDALYARPSHPYTAALLSSVPRLDRAKGDLLNPIPGSPPDLAVHMSGCSFQPRCAYASAECTQTSPPLMAHASDHAVACFHPLAIVTDVAEGHLG